MTSFARQERQQLADLLEQLGPDAPTLCEGWVTRDLAAHLVVRESRPDATVGLIPPLTGYRSRILRETTDQPFDRLVAAIRSGPPAWSPFSWPVVEDLANTVEFFIHHEDVRRAQPGWEPRELPERVQDQLWGMLRRAAPVLYRRAPVSVLVCRADGGEMRARSIDGRATVTVTGAPSELWLAAYGRGENARLVMDGDPLDIERLRHTRLGP